MTPTFVLFDPPAHQSMLADLLSTEEWPFHSQSSLTREQVLARVAAGGYGGMNQETYLIHVGESKLAGMVRLFDLEDAEEPGSAAMFDLRIAAAYRGLGIGTATVQWLTAYVFGKWPTATRIEATTRADNVAMGKVLRKCLFLKEGHYRAAWPAAGQRLVDAAHFGLLRDDWESGTITPIALCEL